MNVEHTFTSTSDSETTLPHTGMDPLSTNPDDPISHTSTLSGLAIKSDFESGEVKFETTFESIIAVGCKA